MGIMDCPGSDKESKNKQDQGPSAEGPFVSARRDEPLPGAKGKGVTQGEGLR